MEAVEVTGAKFVIDFEACEETLTVLRGLAMRFAKDWELLDRLLSGPVRRCCVGRLAGDVEVDVPTEDPLADDRPVA
ncbi:hypothetical protein RRF57_003798 [Xylaria bambusicola]|uniref:Uncharacterized protein n=1 Tax=Xylaria bambusicola TaxID=326684 RepID=A0AAN7UV36_9PEZI